MSKTGTMYINVWNECNLECRHCFNEGGKAKGRLLSASEIFKVLGDAREYLRKERVQMTGGEPTQRPDIFSIIKELHRNKFKIILQTNAAFGKTIREKILKLPAQYLNIIVSVDGIKTHDYFRGPGTFEKTIQNVRILSEKFVIRINTLLSSIIEWEEIEGIADLAQELNLSLAFNPVCPSGRANAAMLMPADKYFEWMDKLEDLRHRGIEVRKCFDLVDDRLVETYECPVRQGAALHVAADGELPPCGFLANNPDCYAGTIRQSSLLALRDMIPQKSRTLSKRCIQCEFYKKQRCHGGCPARIYALYGKFDAVDIYCIKDFYREK